MDHDHTARSDEASLPGPLRVQRMPNGWLRLDDSRDGPAGVDIVLIQPGRGVALLEYTPAWSPDAVDGLRDFLDQAGFTAAHSGHLPIIHRKLRHEDEPDLASLLDDAFDWQEPISLNGRGAWEAELVGLLAVPKATAGGLQRAPIRRVVSVPRAEFPPSSAVSSAYAPRPVAPATAVPPAPPAADDFSRPAFAPARPAEGYPPAGPPPRAEMFTPSSFVEEWPEPARPPAAEGPMPVPPMPIPATKLPPAKVSRPAPPPKAAPLPAAPSQTAPSQAVPSQAGPRAPTPRPSLARPRAASPQDPELASRLPRRGLGLMALGLLGVLGAAVGGLVYALRDDTPAFRAAVFVPNKIPFEPDALQPPAASLPPAFQPAPPSVPPEQASAAQRAPSPTTSLPPAPRADVVTAAPPWSAPASLPPSFEAPARPAPAAAAPPPDLAPAQPAPAAPPPAIIAALPQPPAAPSIPAAPPVAATAPPEPRPVIAEPAATTIPFAESPAIEHRAAPPRSLAAAPAEVPARSVEPAPRADAPSLVEAPRVAAPGEPSPAQTLAVRSTSSSETPPSPIPVEATIRAPRPDTAPAPSSVAALAQPGQGAAAPAGPAASLPTEAAPILAAMLRRGDALLATGDISGARRFFERGATLGSAAAARAMAETFDPATLASRNTRGLQPDPAQALQWYRRAEELGASELAPRIARLEAAR